MKVKNRGENVILEIAKPLKNKGYEFPRTHIENKRPFHNFGNTIVRWSINHLFKSNVRDIMTGYRAFSYEFVKTFPVLSKGFEIETEMSIHAVDKNMLIDNVVIDYRDRPEGSISKLNTYSDGIKVILTIIRLFRVYKPMQFFAWIFAILTKLIEKFSTKAVENEEGTKSFALKVFAVIMLAWIPVWLAFFPCIYGYDIYTQLYSNVYLGNYSTFQPIIHTLFIRICFKVGRMVGSNVAGMALYSMIQMFALAGSITYVLVYLKSRNVKGIKYYIAWFALYPFNPIMAISTTKDVFFSAAVLVVVVYSFKILVKKVSSWSLGGMVVFASVMMLFRNNAIYAFLLAFIISFLY